MQDIRAPDRAPVEIFAGGLEAAAGETWVLAQKRIGTGRADEAGAHAVTHLLPAIDEGEHSERGGKARCGVSHLDAGADFVQRQRIGVLDTKRDGGGKEVEGEGD